jgi:hypothetical protein
VQGVHRLVEALNLSTKVERLKTVVAEGAQSQRIKYLEVFERSLQGVHVGVLLRLKFSSERLGSLVPSKC